MLGASPPTYGAGILDSRKPSFLPIKRRPLVVYNSEKFSKKNYAFSRGVMFTLSMSSSS